MGETAIQEEKRQLNNNPENSLKPNKLITIPFIGQSGVYKPQKEAMSVCVKMMYKRLA